MTQAKKRGTQGRKMRSLDQQIGTPCRSSELAGAIQRKVFDYPGITTIEVVRALAHRFPPAAIVRTIASMCDRESKTLNRVEGRLTVRPGDVDRDSNETRLKNKRSA